MKKIVLLLGFLLIGMISFANTVPANGLLDNVAPALVETNSSLANNVFNITQPYANMGEVESNNLLVRIRTSSCTATATVTIGYGGSNISIQISATASTCAEAVAMILRFVRKL